MHGTENIKTLAVQLRRWSCGESERMEQEEEDMAGSGDRLFKTIDEKWEELGVDSLEKARKDESRGKNSLDASFFGALSVRR